MSRIMIGTPCYGRVVNESYLKSMLATQEALRANGQPLSLFTLSNESLITRARNNIVAGFLGSTCDTLLFIDSDIGWKPQAVLDLDASGYDVCGIPYPTKGYQWERVKKLLQRAESGPSPAAEWTAEQLRQSALDFTLQRSTQQPEGLQKGWLQVDSLGTGFLMIRRHVLERLRDHHREELAYVNDVTGYAKLAPPEHCVALFDTLIDPESRRYLSEDYAFCKRWRDLGGRVYALLNHRLSHTGAHEF